MLGINMTSRYERSDANEILSPKKRWIAPEVTRLEFPKTAAVSNEQNNPDSFYGHLPS